MPKAVWKTFEEAVGAIQQQLDPTARVELDKRLEGLAGNQRQFDVVFRPRAAGHLVLGIIECKDQKRRVGTPQVEGFCKKAEAVGASVRIIASTSGFSKTAIATAQKYGIGLVSLLDEDANGPDLEIRVQWYARVRRWTRSVMKVHFADRCGGTGNSDAFAFRHQDKPVFGWFQRELVTTHSSVREPGWHVVGISFYEPLPVTVGTGERLVQGIVFASLLEVEHRTRQVLLSGEGFYDWHTREVIMPVGASVVTEALERDLRDWEVYTGDIPPPSQGLANWCMDLFIPHFPPTADVADLAAYGQVTQIVRCEDTGATQAGAHDRCSTP
ncbi:MAG TPA: hypothetical protein DGT21_22810 [Armatimonadetes bacterium]|jgi:hypothetical protein|nr:hypothetical protein [Armatimonadota bacterium]